MKIQPRPDPTRNERQARLRVARRKWLKAHGFQSPEGLIGALMRGDYVLMPAIRAQAERERRAQPFGARGQKEG